MEGLADLERIVIWRGDDFELPVTVDSPFPTGSELWFTAKRNEGDSDTLALISVTLSGGDVRVLGTTLDALGQITSTRLLAIVRSSITTTLPAGLVGVFDVQLKEPPNLVYPQGRITTVLYGRCVVEADVTRRTA